MAQARLPIATCAPPYEQLAPALNALGRRTAAIRSGQASISRQAALGSPDQFIIPEGCQLSPDMARAAVARKGTGPEDWPDDRGIFISCSGPQAAQWLQQPPATGPVYQGTALHAWSASGSCFVSLHTKSSCARNPWAAVYSSL